MIAVSRPKHSTQRAYETALLNKFCAPLPKAERDIPLRLAQGVASTMLTLLRYKSISTEMLLEESKEHVRIGQSDRATAIAILLGTEGVR